MRIALDIVKTFEIHASRYDHEPTGGSLITTRVITLTSRQFKLLQRSTFSKWQARDEGRATTIRELLAKYSAFIIRSDGTLLGVATDSIGRSQRSVLDAHFVDEKGFKALQFQFASVDEKDVGAR
ncbi:MAG: hypothetical protein ABSB81_10365 [Halobacteriota archaeon]